MRRTNRRKIRESYYTSEFDRAVTAKKIDDIVNNLEDYSTQWIPITNINGKQYALVFGRPHIDGDDDDSVWGKIAYCDNRSFMKEYDIDWIMPYDEETGEVWDTEGSGVDGSWLSWWRSEWEAMDEAGIFDADYEAEFGSDDDYEYESCHKRSSKKR